MENGQNSTSRPKKFFATDTMLMALVLSLLSWGGVQLVGSSNAIAALQEKHVVLDKNSILLTETSNTLLRMEISQEHFNLSMNKDLTLIKDSLVSINEQVEINSRRGE